MEVAKLPPQFVPALREFWSEPRYFKTLARDIRSLPALAESAAACTIPREMPVTVLSGSHQSPAQLAAHRSIATRHIVVDGSAHWIHLDRPDLVADAILEIAAPSK